MTGHEYGPGTPDDVVTEARRVLGEAVATLGALGLDDESVLEMVGELLESEGENDG